MHFCCADFFHMFVFSDIDIDLFSTVFINVLTYWICEVCVRYRGLKLVNVQFFLSAWDSDSGADCCEHCENFGFHKNQGLWAVWYVSCARLPHVVLLSLDGINAGVPWLALLFLPSCCNHTNYCTWRKIRRLVLRNIAGVPLSLHSTLLFRLRLVVSFSFGQCPYWLWLVFRVIPSHSYNFLHSHFSSKYLVLHYLSLSPFLYYMIFL
jgi:hypothetical protein